MIERHQDYVLRGITVPANGSVQYQIPLDPDAPFALRCLLSSGMPLFGGAPDARAVFQFTITGMDQRRYMGGNGTPLAGLDSLIQPASLPFIFYPQITFPSNVTIQVTVYDISGAGITNGVLTFRGTKLFQPGVVFGPQYPIPYSELNFRYAYPFTLPQGTTNVPAVIASQPLDIQSDADFAVRMCSFATTSGVDGYDPTGTDCILRDQYGKAYSNDWVPMGHVFPQYPQDAEPYSTIYPEIYIPKSQQLLLDLRRTSGTAPGGLTVVLHGSKIFQAGF